MKKCKSLLEACKTGDVKKVDAFLRNPSGHTGNYESDFCKAVEYAIDNGFNDIVAIFIHCDRYLRYRWRKAAFYWYEQNLDTMTYKWEDYAQLDESDSDCSWCDCDFLDKNHPIRDNISFEHGVTPLMYATLKGNIEMVKFMLTHYNGMQNKYGMTALMYAAYYGQLECVKLLIPYEKQLRDRNHWTALMYCLDNRSSCVTESGLQCVSLLADCESGLHTKNDFMAIHFAARYGYANCVKILINKETAEEDDPNPPIILAAKYGNLECVKILVNYECKMKDRHDKSALFRAAEAGHTDIVEFLIPYLARERSNLGYTALMVSVYYNNIEIVKKLAPHEAGIQDEYGKTALLHALDREDYFTHNEDNSISEECLLEYIKILAPKECNIYHKDKLSPLMYVCKIGSSKIVETLITHGVNLSNDKSLKDTFYACYKYNISIDFLRDRIKADKFFVFYESISPFIPIGSFLDILNKAAKQEGQNYDDSMSEIIDKLEKLPLSVLLEYSKISDLDKMKSKLVNEFSEYKEGILRVIQEIKTEKKECSVCLDKSKQLYRNCVNCMVNICKDCWRNLDKCPQCNCTSLIWQKSLLFEALKCIAKISKNE